MIMNNLKNKIALFVTILGILSIVAGSSYALFTTNVEESSIQLVTAGGVSVELKEKTQGINLNLINDKEKYNYSTSTIFADDNYYQFNIKNTSDTAIKYGVYLIDGDSVTGNLLDDKFVKVVVELNGKVLGIYNVRDVARLLDESYMQPNAVNEYKLRFGLDYSYKTDSDELNNTEKNYKIKVVASQYFDENEKYIEPNAPKLTKGSVSTTSTESNMIAVTYDETAHLWRKADASNSNNGWYDYKNGVWANAVTVKDTSTATTLTLLDGSTKACSSSNCLRTDYLDAPVGTVIPITDMNSMWVWIPRFKYKIFNANLDGNGLSSPQQIQIVFEQGVSNTGTVSCTDNIGINTYKSEDCSDSYYNEVTGGFSTYTHPAFTFDDQELTGFWFGKFEISNNATTNTVEILPDKSSLVNKNISTYFELIRSMELSGNAYGFASNASAYNATGELTGDDNNIDTHVVKNMEWAAVAYLSQSKYGRCQNDSCEDIYLNNAGYKTGMSAGAAGFKIKTLEEMNPNFSGLTDSNRAGKYHWAGYYTYDARGTGYVVASNDYQNDLHLGYGASTTGNIYGAYDMVGGGKDYVMFNMISSTSDDFNVGSSGWTDVYPNSKYYDKYSYVKSLSGENNLKNAKLGDGYKETHILNTSYSASAWYSVDSYWGNTSFVNRGGYPVVTSASLKDSGLFGTINATGVANVGVSTRAVLVVN